MENRELKIKKVELESELTELQGELLDRFYKSIPIFFVITKLPFKIEWERQEDKWIGTYKLSLPSHHYKVIGSRPIPETNNQIWQIVRIVPPED